MIKILVVEDQYEKRRRVIAHLTSLPGIGMENIEYADNVIDAKRKLKRTKYALLVLDINIPLRSDQAPVLGGGLDLIAFIKGNNQAIPPSYIFGMTAYDESFLEAAAEFSSALWKLVMFDPADDSWTTALTAAVSFLVSHHQPPYENDGTTYHVDVGIVVALEEELSPFRDMLEGWSELTVPNDPARYFTGSVALDDRAITVIAVACPRMGLPVAAVSASKLIIGFRPRYLVTAGICAGVKDKTELGDLLVSDPCFDWGSGKWVSSSDGALEFKPAAYPWRLSEVLRREVVALGERASLLADLAASFKGSRPARVPTVLVDAMASGGSVLQADPFMAAIRAQHKNLIGIDMESYAVLTAAEYCGSPQPKAIAVKSVCDFGDGQKNDQFHGYASHMSACFVLELLKRFDYE